MGRSRKKKPLHEQVTIVDVGAEGKAIAKVDDVVVFTSHVVPGDVVDIQVTKKRKRYHEGFVAKIHEYSKDRVDAICNHYGVCGGCKWQNLPYEKQLEYKQKQVTDQLSRIGKIDLPETMSIMGSAATDFYRNKLEFTFSNKRWLTNEEVQSGADVSKRDAVGFHIPGMFDKVIDVHKCWLQSDPSNAIRNEIRDYALKHELEFFDLKEQVGFLRTMVVRTTSTGELMLIVAFFQEDKEKREALLNHLVEKFPQLTSLIYVINSKRNDSLADQDMILFHGRDHIYEEMEGLKFKIGPKSFYQTNSDQAYELYKVTREFAGLTGNEVVYDLYTGTGTIANFVAKKAKQVVGIEYVPDAIDDAKINSQNNGIENTLFYAGDMKDILTDEFVAKHGKPDVIITDPPRAGMHDDVVKVMLNAAPERIVYVSCNPATQARDLNLLDEKYRVVKVQPVDMFPHTHHVENVVLLERK
ncbi:23S rRNA (uracil(1939)-C(5))-methyltransferase RlmD [Prolixibacteraceae bacterium JC049]|nr:23S rRNA (uracil(1939)-C(5))-methyltransferase RlmD [Prolixibacteraceae bacterium JC049]